MKTLFGKSTGFGGFLEMGAKAGDINGQSGLFVGGAFAAVFSSKMNIGLAGYGLTTGVDADTYDDNNKLYHIDMGYGGLLIEPVLWNKNVVHLTAPTILGVGGAGLRSNHFLTREERDSLNRDRDFHHDDSDAFIVVEPGLSVEINLLRNVRLDLGATYRYI